MLELHQVRDVGKRDLAEARGGHPRRAAGVALDGVAHLAHLDTQHVGEDLTPDARGAAAAGQVDGRDVAAQELAHRLHQPAGVEGDTFEEGAHKVFAGVLRAEVVHAGPQGLVVHRCALAPQPGRVQHSVAAGRHPLGDAVEDLEHVRHALLGQQLVLVVEDVVAQERQVAAGRGLQGRQQVAAGDGARDGGQAGQRVGLLERNVGADPGRGANVEVRSEVVHRTGPDSGRGVVYSPGDHLHAGAQAQGRGRLLGQRAEHLRARHDLRQLVGLYAAGADEARVVVDGIRIAVVGDPRSEDGVEGGDEPSGEPQVQVVEHVEELVCALVDLREGVTDQQHVCGGILAGRRGHTAGEADPTKEARRAEAGVVERAAELLAQIRRAAHVHPQDGVHEGTAVSVHRDRALALRRTADGRYVAGGVRHLGE